MRGVWVRHALNTRAKRLKALEAKVAQDGLILTESPLAVLEEAEADKEAPGEFDSACPGYCGVQDTFYVGALKGVGRIYQQPFVDTDAKVGFACPSARSGRVSRQRDAQRQALLSESLIPKPA